MTELECVRKKKGGREGVMRQERRGGGVEGAGKDDGAASPLGWQMKCRTWRRDLFHCKLQTRRGC